jgi:DNA-binding LacI/PurR family transcriptional regulator
VTRSARDPVMADVAELAGVSNQTVSRVINDHPNVRQPTRMRVRAAIAELHYRPNRAARVLATGTSRVVGVICPRPLRSGPAEVLTALTETALGQGFTIAVESVRTTGRRPLSEAIGRHLNQRVAGLAVFASVDWVDSALDSIPQDVPLVRVGGDPRHPAPLVAVDEVAGADQATRCLLDAGHRTVWHVSGPGGWVDSHGRMAGWQQALTEAGAEEVPPLIPADWQAASGYRAGQIFGRIPEVSAVFAASDHLALGILRALRECGRRVPHDVGVAGFDDVPEAAYLTPPLTTVRPDYAAVAADAIDLLQAQISAGYRIDDRRIIRPALITRASVTPR